MTWASYGTRLNSPAMILWKLSMFLFIIILIFYIT
jgi:hypothetical protein